MQRCGLRAHPAGRIVSALQPASSLWRAREKDRLEQSPPVWHPIRLPRPARLALTHRSARAAHGRATPAIEARAALRAQGGRRERTG